MGKALIIKPYVTPECDSCNEAVTQSPYAVHGNPERFCSLVCCKIFYAQPNAAIRQHRQEVH